MATAKTYLTLVNDAIRESGVDLNEINTADSGAEFASPSDALQIRFKHWVNEAYRELQLERQQYESAVVQVYKPLRPRIRIDTTATPDVTALTDYVLGEESEAFAQVVAKADGTGTWTSGTYYGHLELDNIDGRFKFGETLDRANSSGTVQTANWCAYVGFGRYNLQNAFRSNDTTAPIGNAYSVFQPDLNSMFLHEGVEEQALDSSEYDNDATLLSKKIYFLSWNQWMQLGYEDETADFRGVPEYCTKTPDGLYDFYPRPNTEYRLSYLAQMAIDELSAYTDTPDNLPADYHYAIVWRAVMYYAEYDDKNEVFRRAERRFMYYKLRMEELLMPRITWGPNRIY